MLMVSDSSPARSPHEKDPKPCRSGVSALFLSSIRKENQVDDAIGSPAVLGFLFVFF